MGVMECSRMCCENVMCNRYSSNHGYICYECFAELEERQETDLHKFMAEKHRKMPLPESKIDYDQVFPVCGH